MPPDGELSDAIISIRSSSACSTSTSVIVPQKDERDPRKMARAYQLELCAKAMEENIIVYLGTGCGKTHIAVLLIYGLGHLIREPQRSVCIFLAPTVALVHQQAKVIEESTDFKVAIHCGSPKHLKSLSGWEKEIEEHEVLVMTPQVLLHGLSHSIIKMEFITLLIFDECHHAQVQSNHPYAQIMKVFYKPNNGKNPRIFGMTASPVVGKGASSQENLPKSINSLENILDAKVYSVDDEQLERFVAAPLVKVYLYGPVANNTSGSLMFYYNELERVKRQCLSEIGMKAGDHKNLQTLRHTKKSLIRMHENIMFCLKSLGVWGALQVCRILLGGDHCERNAVIEAVGDIIDEVVHGRYLNQVSSIFTNNCTRDGIISDISREEVLKEPFFSEKLLRLIGILSTFSLQPHMKCIVFVNRIATARSLAYILQNLKVLTSWKSDFLVGVHSGLKMSRKIMNGILEKFRDGKLNLLVATKVGEEGLDIQTCCLVIRFDLPETVSSFIQSRGRARMPQSEYVFLVDSGNQTEVDLIENFKKDEFRMHMEIFSRTSKETFTSKDEPVYKVEASGASISSGYSISLLHHYCAKLPHDEFFDPKPMFNYLDDLGGTVCLVNLPCNAPIHQVASTPQSSVEAAKKDACLKTIEQLHKLGALNDFLLPGLDPDLESEVTVSDSNSSDESSRGELHEMMIPTALKESWSLSENLVYLHSYIVKFFPVPEDRIYKKFALFVKVPLPQEAERLELDLHLARGRSVFTKLVPSGVSAFTKEEIMEAMNFQEMFLKVILDRSKFVQEFVLLGNNGVYESCPTFYLLLPILDGHENRVVADRETVKRCLSSPIFQNPVDVINTKYFSSDPQLQMANGCQSICDIENSLVYARYRNTFYFVTNTIPEKNGHSPHKGSSGPSHMEHLIRTFDIQLKCPEQPLLRAKPLFFLHNLLHSRRQEDTESQDMDEFFVDLVPELCELKIKGFSKDIGSSISLLPSVMHRLENLLVALELKALLSASFSEAAEVSALRILEALTTERCQERFSLERLEILGDAFLKFAVSRHLFLLHDTLDEGGLTRRRSNIVNNSNLFKLAIRSNLQVYIRDQPLDPCQFFALGYPCPRICTKDSEVDIHHQCESHMSGKVVGSVSELRCSKGHHWLHNKTVADVVEALVGAFVVDSGFKAAIAFLRWVGIKVDFETSQVINACQASAVYMPLSSSMDIANFEESFGYKFLYKGLLLQAFMHPSFNNGGGCYQRLEFLGDAALDYLITSYLFSVYPKLKPGLLTDLRSASVNNRVFATVSIEHSFDKFLMCDGSSGLSEAIQKFINFFKTAKSERGLLDEPKCPKVLSDLVESCMGAISLDTGFNLKRMWNVMISLLDPRTSFSNFQANPVKEMNEICQSRNWENPILVEKKGKTFFVEQRVVGKDVFISAAATNTNKKEAIRVTSEKIYLKLKDQGHIPKTNYLEEFLRTNQMMEAKLIGYDETPVEVAVPDAIRLKSLKIEEPFFGQRDSKIHSIKKVSDGFQPSLAVTEQAPSQLDSSGRQPGGSCHVSARSRLYEICTANCWKSPLFECCCEEGPSHLKCFTFKVSVEIEEAPDMLLECVGAPQATKKAAAEEAAKGAIWYLESRGYLH